MSNFYDTCFYPNTCHVCKQFGKDITLKRCGRCFLISYCSKLHQVQDWPSHKKFCKVMQDVLKQHNLPNLDRNLNNDEWYKLQKDVITLASAKMNLQPYEQEMIWFMRACLVCHRQNNLEQCYNCPVISFCAEHKEDIIHNCEMLKLCFDLDISIYDDVYIDQKNLPDISDKNIFDNMHHFIDMYVNSWNDINLPSEKWTAIYSQHFTRPLSIFYAMSMQDYLLKREKLVIHVAGSSYVEMLTLHAWEVLLHLVPALKSIHVVFVGYHLKVIEDLTEWCLAYKRCEACRKKKQKISFDLRDMPYDVYMHDTAFKEPDLYVKFNSDFNIYHSNSTWFSKESIEFIAQLNCLYILTFYNEKYEQMTLRSLTDMLKDKIEVIYNGDNPFPSLRPYRELVSRFFYENSRLVICKNLHPK